MKNLKIMKEKSKSTLLAEDLLYAAFCILKENNNEMSTNLLIQEIEKRVQLDEWAKEVYKSGYTRWVSALSFYSIDCVKAGYLIKNKGIWYLTKEGEDALKLGKEQLKETATAKYRIWAEKNIKNNELTVDNNNVSSQELDSNNVTEEIKTKDEQIVFENIEAKSKESISNYIKSLTPYEFQDLCSALLRGMGYYTPFVAPKGKDGGVDIIAYRDPLGASTPRIKIQVKHRENKATAQEVRELSGILKSSDIGIFISTGGFTPDATSETKIRNNHIELIDMDRFIDLWIEFFSKMKDEDKNLMSIKPVWFLDEKI